ncbi:hypothetical protein FOA43_000149 [Brettanomyces nanus]|uniref:ATPase synthesis protein 25 n=1 Tax=Eeniella nana TaxID=13502 RepID=A0A875RST2_EENNA|nr:uncharacterized protein FOA43_000149 [Brettanomyces nanus]QPG72847.1 hypothetical protein FOA43_000149 [Brettanomyces nanus]
MTMPIQFWKLIKHRDIRRFACANRTIFHGYIGTTSSLNRHIHTSIKCRQDDSQLPWYMRPEESPKISSPLNKVEIPNLPENSPQTLRNIVEFLVIKLGIIDTEVFDLRDDEEGKVNEGAKDIANFMVIGTGKSAKHLRKASTELTYFIKHKLHQVPSTEGLVTNGEYAKYQRRLRKKGKGGPQYAKFDYGASENSWVMTDSKSDGIYIHMLTKDRREDLNLEFLWAKDKSKYHNHEGPKESDNILTGLRYYSTAAPHANADATIFHPEILTRANYGQRFQQLKKEHLEDPTKVPIVEIQNHFDAMQANGLQLNVDDVYSYVDLICQSLEFHLGLEHETDVFNKRYHYTVYILKRYQPVFSGPRDLKKLLPLLVVSGSQFDNDQFVTLDKLSQLSDDELLRLGDEVFKYSPVVHKLYQISLKLTGKRLDVDRFQSEMDILCLTIFTNRKNWVYSKKVVENALKREDLNILTAALRLIAIKGDTTSCSEFLNLYYPLLTLYKEFDLNQDGIYVRMMLSKCDPEGSHHEEIRETL